MEIMITLPAYADYVEEAAAHDVVGAVRFNTVLPVREDLASFLASYRDRVRPKELWIDLKCRQLRIVQSAYIPCSWLEISHRIEVDTPVEASFCSGEFVAVVKEVVDGNRLIVEEVSPVPLGSGMSLSIDHPSLRIEGYLTERDRAYVEAASSVGLHDYLLSYVEGESDVEELLALDPEARILAKIESTRGMAFIERLPASWKGRVRLMAARGDLFNELPRPHRILAATRRILEIDPDAVAASRIFSSLRRSRRPQCAELGDVGWLLELGYRTLMFGDEICFQRESLMSALAVMEAIRRDGF